MREVIMKQKLKRALSLLSPKLTAAAADIRVKRKFFTVVCRLFLLFGLFVFCCLLMLIVDDYLNDDGDDDNDDDGGCFDADKSCARVQRGEFLRQTNISFCPPPPAAPPSPNLNTILPTPSKFGYNFLLKQFCFLAFLFLGHLHWYQGTFSFYLLLLAKDQN